MKTTKKVLAILIVAMMIVAMLPNALAEGETYTLTINNSEAGYTYTAYQIFTGSLSGGGSEPYKLTNIVWGSGITDAGKNALATFAGITVAEGDTADAAAVAEELVGKDANAIAGIVKANLGTAAGTVSATPYTFSFSEPGYYFVENTQVPSSDTDTGKAYSDYIVQVVGSVTVNPKSAYPTVDKQVWDETDDAENGASDGWGESADHAINESFQFKLIAHIPNDGYIDSYDTYKLVFTDTMSDGVTFESIASVTIGGTTVSNYTCTATAGQKGGSWKLTIEDAKQVASDLKGKDVVVIYNAHLNEDALTVAPANPAASSTNANTNKVGLAYSNNPNLSTSMGKTAEDTVFVFTYNVPNFKYYMNGETETPLPEAGFKLYIDEACANEIKMAGSNGVYYRASSAASEEMFPGADGNFTIKGLDVGTYYLKETTTPTGYNTCPVMTIQVSASTNHVESSDGISASVTYTLSVGGTATAVNKILNQVGATLPTTGGIGTTMFYVIGSVLVIGAVVLLVSKKRMNAIE